MKIRLTRRGEIVLHILQTIGFISVLTAITLIAPFIEWII